MKEILEKIGLSEFFAYICPGGILLFSLALWKRPNFESPFWKQEALVIILGLIVSYTLGLILASFNDTAQIWYLRSSATQQTKLLNKIWIGIVRFFYRFPSPRHTSPIVEANLRIGEELERLSGLGGLSSLASPWDRLMIYRVLMADRVGDKSKSVLVEADTLHKRFRFSMGMAMSVLFLALQSLIRLAIRLILLVPGIFPNVLGNLYGSLDTFYYQSLPPIGFLLLLFVAIFGLWASIQLRHVAIRMWELERYLTASLTASSTSTPAGSSESSAPPA